MPTLVEILNILFRWIHVFSGITWIGLLYFFNFVNANFAATLDADTKKKVVPELMPRALFFFRWSAMATFLAGLVLLYLNYMPNGGSEFTTSRGHWIMMGAGFATIMWFNVWFIIWPNQRKIINGVKQGNPAPANVVKTAALASKINVFLSFPMLFAMLAAGGHFLHDEWYWFLGVILVGFAIAQHLYKVAPKISTNV
ncbi:MAG TPA: urate hydroxylase PuuD [bacterium]|nr:urate hydroxylase PuuD [bacterium]